MFDHAARSFGSFVALFIACTLPLAPASADDVLMQFDEDRIAQQWVTVNDNVMGGRSRGGPSFSDGVLTFAGSTNTNGGGFSSIRTRDRDWGLEGAEGLVVRVKGDGRTYMLDVRTDVAIGRRVVAYRAEFETKNDGQWQEVRVPFENFRPTVWGQDVSDRVPAFDPARARTLGLMIYDGNDGAFELLVDWIATYAEDEEADASMPTLPPAWVGVWEGDATSTRASGTTMTFRTRLEIEPIDETSWTWTLTFGEGRSEQVRRYTIEAVPDAGDATGRFRIDEQNGIVLDQWLVGPSLLGRFTVNGSDIVTSYTLSEDRNSIEMVLTTFDAGAEGSESGGAGDVPSVMSVRPVGVQRGVLGRVSEEL